MISTIAPMPWTFSALICMSTGRAFSIGVFIQPPAPKLLGPPSMIRPAPMSWTLCLEQLVLALGERVLGDVGEDHRVVRLELAEVVGSGVAADAAGRRSAGRPAP